MSKYKVLVLGGGGYFGLINTIFLSYLGKDYCIPKVVNSISGCSIGGIEACALMAGNDAEDIKQGFINFGDDIFTKRLANKVNIMNIPFYDNSQLKLTLERFCGYKTLKDTKSIYPDTTMFIPCYNMTKGALKVFDNIRPNDENVSLVDVGLYTSAAMFYFPVLRNEENHCIVDGGIREVIPVLTHTTGIKHKLKIDFKDMDVFVLCAGNSIDRKCGCYHDINKWGPIDWLTNFLIGDITESNACTSKFWAEQLGFNKLEWFNPIQITGSLDDVTKTDYLLTECEMYKELFLDKWDKFLA